MAISVATLDQIRDGGTLRVVVDGQPVALVRCGDRVFALGDTCTHAEASLSEGDVDCDEGTVECPLHGSAFRLTDGVPLTLPATRTARSFAVEVRDGEVLLTEGEGQGG
jgi:3-phenylpropionate/trans-cinnamate dioxygenase ferredoxin component